MHPIDGSVANSPQHQHVLSEWLLKSFGARVGGKWYVTAFDKATGEYKLHNVDDFLVELDGHSIEVESEINLLEGPASEAALRLKKFAKALAPGVYAVLPSGPSTQTAGPAVSDKGVIAGLHILVGEHSIGGPSPSDRLALARYAGLMYQRAPKTETAILRWGLEYDRGTRTEVARIAPWLNDLGPFTSLAHRRARLVDLARRIGDRLNTASWWVVRSAPGRNFVLGDTPVVSTTALGVDQGWRAILADDVFTVVMPLGPTVALLMAPQHIFPVMEIDFSQIGEAINRLVWRCADRYVLGRSQLDLEFALPNADDNLRRASVPIEHDSDAIAVKAASLAHQVIADAVVELTINRPLERSWQRWERCLLRFGYAPFAPDDRDQFVSDDRNGLGLQRPCRLDRLGGAAA